MSHEIDLSAIHLRAAVPGDEDFLLELYREERAAEFAAYPWTPEQLDAFIRMQYEARRRGHGSIPGVEAAVIELHGTPLGTLSVSREGGRIHIVNIALRSDARNKAVGTMLLTRILAEADSVGKPVSLSVQTENPAARLYRRLGFEEMGNDGMYVRLERRPTPSRA